MPPRPPPHGPQGDALTGTAGFPGARPSAEDPVDAWVEAARAGDREAFAQLVTATFDSVYTLALRLTGDEDDACDVVQDAYLRAYRALPQFRGDARFSTWLFRITTNCAGTHLNRRRRHRHAPIDEVVAVAEGHGTDPFETTARGDLRRELEDAIAELSPSLRAVVLLRDVYDLPHDAIAQELGISTSAAKVRLHRARRQLRHRLFPAERRARAV